MGVESNGRNLCVFWMEREREAEEDALYKGGCDGDWSVSHKTKFIFFEVF
jgi:hypothetical protein